MLPGHFRETGMEGGLLERQKGTKVVPEGLNDLNEEAPAFYVRYRTFLCHTSRIH